MKNRRLFFALWPSDTVRIELAAQAQSHAALGRPIAARNLHITAVFLGAVREEQVDSVRETGKLTHSGKFLLHLDRMEFWRRSNLIALTASHTPAQLLTIVHGLRARLRERGFDLRDHDSFRPHVTLVRDVAHAAVETEVVPVRWAVESFALVESQVGQRGSEYTVLNEWPLE